MKKMTRKLIPAFIMLLVSAIMLSTASYAWFANSYNVTADGMSVKVNSDAKFLLISDDNIEFDDSVTLEENNTAVVDLVTATLTDGEIDWFTGTSTEADDPNASSPLTPVDDEKLGRYVLTKTFYVKLSDGSNGSLYNLEISGVTITGSSNLKSAVRVIAKGADGAQLWKTNKVEDVLQDAMVEDTAAGNSECLISEITKGTAKEVTVYIYYDGKDDSAFINNAGALDYIGVSVSFTATPVNPNA